jgi:hypothetical protein
MESAWHRARGLENVISICLLAVLVLIGAGVLIKQRSFDMALFGRDIAVDARTPVKAEASTSSEKSILSPLAPAGLKALSEIETYTTENLYEKINGKAPLYTDSGFEKLSTQRFVSSDDANAIAEVYLFDMGTVKNAFSVYSVQIRAEAEFLPDLTLTYKTTNAVYFVHGRYYAEMLGFVDSPQLVNAMVEFARNIQTILPAGGAAQIAELGFFPQENLIGGSAKLYLTSAFGFEGLTDTFIARYEIDGETVAAFLSKRSDAAEAQKITDSYFKFLIDNGATAKQAASTAIEGKVVDFYGTTEIVFAKGPFVAGIHEAQSQSAAEKLAEILTKRISEIIQSNVRQ